MDRSLRPQGAERRVGEVHGGPRSARLGHEQPGGGQVEEEQVGQDVARPPGEHGGLERLHEALPVLAGQRVGAVERTPPGIHRGLQRAQESGREENDQQVAGEPAHQAAGPALGHEPAGPHEPGRGQVRHRHPEGGDPRGDQAVPGRSGPGAAREQDQEAQPREDPALGERAEGQLARGEPEDEAPENDAKGGEAQPAQELGEDRDPDPARGRAEGDRGHAPRSLDPQAPEPRPQGEPDRVQEQHEQGVELRAEVRALGAGEVHDPARDVRVEGLVEVVEESGGSEVEGEPPAEVEGEEAQAETPLHPRVPRSERRSSRGGAHRVRAAAPTILGLEGAGRS